MPARRHPRQAPALLLSLFALPLVVLLLPGAEGSDTPPKETPVRSPRKLIEFGWDEPDTAFLRQHLAEMERMPFDGCVFHALATDAKGRKENFSFLCWGSRAFPEAELQPALDDLKAISFRRFTHNFLRFNTTPGRIDWFDDYSAVLANARLAARLAREGQGRGILLDVEEYEGKLFTYPEQRDAKTRSWDQYAAQARRRGGEVMRAFQDGYPDLVVLLTFGYSLPHATSGDGKGPLARSQYGLLAPFLDGMVDAARGEARLVDGYELSYGYQEPAQFARAYNLMTRGVLPLVADKDRYRRVVSAGFGLWLDYDWRKRGWDAEHPERNYFSPAKFEAAVRQALGRSDEYVWVYTETPRWWSGEGKPVKLPAAYPAALRRARKGLAKE